jgi:protoheme IX farnesyltransferase
MISQFINLFKLRIGVIMMLTALVAMVITPGDALHWWQVVTLGLSVLVAAAAAGAFNQYYEVDLDRQMRRTRNRPFVTGTFTKGPAWIIMILLMVGISVTAAALALNISSAVYIFMGAFFYGVVYTVWLKRRTWMNIVIGGASGSFAVLAGSSAIDPTMGMIPGLFALVLFFWTPSHFWSLAIAKGEEYRAAGVPMLPVVAGKQRAAQAVLLNSLVLVFVSVLPFFYGLGWIYLFGAVTGGGFFIYRNVQLVYASSSTRAAMASFFASLIQLSLLLITAVADRLILT